MLTFFLALLMIVLPPPPEPIKMPACVQFMGYTWLSNGDIGLSFYNQCGIPMKINVCVTDYFGKLRLYQSKSPVRDRGWYRVYLDNNQQPRSYDFAYALQDPPIPGACRH